MSGDKIRSDAAETLSGVRSLRPDEISFVHGVSRQDGVLRFTMSDGIAADEVFGVEPGRENDVTVFAAYDLERGAVRDALDVKMFADDGDGRRSLNLSTNKDYNLKRNSFRGGRDLFIICSIVPTAFKTVSILM